MSKARLTTLIVLLLAVLGCSGAARAVALFEGLANLSLTLQSINGGPTIPTGVSIDYSAGIFDKYTDTYGAASATATETLAPGAVLVPMAIGGTLQQSVRVSGQAGEGAGYSTSLVQTTGLILIENLSNDAITLSFVYSFTASVEALIALTGFDATAGAGWFLTDDLGLVNLGDAIFADALLGPTTNFLSLSGTLELELNSGESDTLLSQVDTNGFAEAPEPPVAALLISGLLGAAATRPIRRTRRAA
ncbi:hypothetical protein [uncultured Lamprocystis sp.]|jgi:hypothetical protein|uniref:hypothetical protein n=1 Tax=uncultured Lamprocystis sp. TaxID=543132 RepID=UPI0025E14516|nr:hypothetical protein [uncultured Lamprocystis sp.]